MLDALYSVALKLLVWRSTYIARLDEIVGSLAPAERMRAPYPRMRSRLAQQVSWR